MAVYSNLLLSTGGGIISSQQQAEQAHDTATVLIGLGGTGVHCIRTIKTQVHTRLKPDDENAVVPTYEHIRFIGVDTTDKSQGGALKENKTEENKKADAILPLDDTEFFSIANKKVASALSNKLAIKQRRELAWLEHENIKASTMTDAGAGGNRQVGRFMLMDKSESFLARVEQEINLAKMGLNNPRVNVHIFSGLSGGTGSGCFLDVCYMVRSIAEKVDGLNIFGYFFMPDVNLSTVSMDNTDVRNYIPKNGYAAMQELDYCMCLQQNGGSFEQLYQGHHSIKWNRAPVDMCHLVCATDQNANVIPNAYNYAMNVTAEYVMDFLTYSDEEFGLAEHLSNFRSMVAEADAKKTIGAEMAYCVIGASCASIPLREINTYLAAEIFDKFGSIRKNTPNKTEVEYLAVSALAKDAKNVSGVYDSLYRELRDGAMGEYGQYQDDWKFVRDYGNSELVQHYTNQTASQLNRAEANARSMVSADNKKSLLGRLQTQLTDIIRDIQRGPIYAYRMLAASESHNFLNIVDGLIAENTSRWNQEAAQSELRTGDYENAKADFDRRRKRGLFDNDEKRFNDYEYYLMLLEQHKLAMQVYDKLDTVLRKFREQIVEATAAYYIKLNRVMDTLIDTFAENKNALSDQEVLQQKGTFAIPMMTIDELKKSLDAEIAKINVPGMLDAFMVLLLNSEDDWIMEDENKIARLVIKFFTDVAFSGFTNRTITSFLKDKYENKVGGKITDAQLTNYVYNDWMKLLTSKASPLFYFNSSIWSENTTSRLASLSFPSISAPIKAAAEKMFSTNDRWRPKESALTDRVFVMCCACGLPLSAYNNCTSYERMFFSAKSVGRHYYEGKEIPGVEFTDWNKLPSITPQSLIDLSNVPKDLAELISESRELYSKACELGVIDGESYICTLPEETVSKMTDVCDSCEKVVAGAKNPQDIAALEKALSELEHALELPLTRTAFSFPQDGNRSTNEFIGSIREDHFVYSPAVHPLVRKNVSEIETMRDRVNKLLVAANAKIASIRESGNAIADYCDAIFSGVIAIEGRVVVYHQDNYGIITDITLSKKGEEFAFGSIPAYQGFISYQKLPAETKNEIKKLANDRINADAPELYSTGKALKEVFTGDRLTAWMQIAADFEQRAEIVAFIGDLKKRFDTYCKENGI